MNLLTDKFTIKSSGYPWFWAPHFVHETEGYYKGCWALFFGWWVISRGRKPE